MLVSTPTSAFMQGFRLNPSSSSDTARGLKLRLRGGTCYTEHPYSSSTSLRYGWPCTARQLVELWAPYFRIEQYELLSSELARSTYTIAECYRKYMYDSFAIIFILFYNKVIKFIHNFYKKLCHEHKICKFYVGGHAHSRCEDVPDPLRGRKSGFRRWQVGPF